MIRDQLTRWALDQTTAAATVVVVLAAALTALAVTVVRRTSGAVLTAGLGAAVATAFSGDTSWRFAGHQLGMADSERLGLFAAGEIALLACAVMARANKKATATDTTAGTPGVPGVLVWCITGVQTIPAYAESGLLGGTVRTVFGPVMAALLWHLAMGLEIRVTTPDALSTGLPAQIGAELRERLLSYLGLATRNRSAEQISRDRATARAVRLASRRWLGPWGSAALAASVARSGASVHAEQRQHLMQLLAGRRTATELRTVPIASPWISEPVPDPYPATPLGVTGAELRRLEPMDAILRVRAAHPDRTPTELAAITTEYGVPVTDTLVRIALRAGNPDPVPASVPAVPERPQPPAPARPLTTTPEPADNPAPAVPAAPVPDAPLAHSIGHVAGGLHLDLTTHARVHRDVACAVPAAMIRSPRTRSQVHARVPDVPTGLEDTGAFIQRRALEEREAAAAQPRTRTQVHAVPRPAPVPEYTPVPPGRPVPASVPAVPAPRPDAPGTGDTEVLDRARAVDAEHRRTRQRPASIRVLKAELGIGQTRAERIRAALDTEAARKA
ncbi:hypothetical protein PV396_24510 [Streptomyces sp. ME02-8801-2C]|uniref:hypothetical protein n=1 Tax=Streptomyces sp. ME02-8801-2C TaxID=3028680 RepID=UPI0029A5AAD5|nr:hypothetical protein [Streptomyces sp. ME02-8801-2C]MDX3455065.1 hypothetical protein [Streptomyces sp. ME02-8801-2C]